MQLLVEKAMYGQVKLLPELNIFNKLVKRYKFVIKKCTGRQLWLTSQTVFSLFIINVASSSCKP